MSWEAITAVAAVVISLFYLSREVRGNQGRVLASV